MKKILETLIQQALNKIGLQAPDKIQIEYTRDQKHGDLSCNIAMIIAKQTQQKPLDLANIIASHLPAHPALKKIQTAGNGFINFFLHPQAFEHLLSAIFEEKTQYGHSQTLKNKKIHIEFVSSNPTGPLHVGHGRCAAYGAAVADLLSAMGADVHREYYVNDAGRQMDILTCSVYLRYLEQFNAAIDFPPNGYQGDYIRDIAKTLKDANQDTYYQDPAVIFENIHVENKNQAIAHTDINLENNQENNQDQKIDNIIFNIKTLLGQKIYLDILMFALNIILQDIKQDLTAFGIDYQAWFSERKIWDNGDIKKGVDLMRDKNYLYPKDGAQWFTSTAFGDDKDRVVIRENGQYTYFASDIAYHKYKFERYTDIITILGADHHGYIARLKSIIQALGYPVENFHAPLVQFATLYRGKERLPMSTRSGEFVTLRQLREEIGKDAARFFYIMRKADQHMDFDLELAKSHSNDNPVYYIQYAHARIVSVFRQLSEKKLDFDPKAGLSHLNRLDTDTEKSLLLILCRYSETLELAALNYEPHLIAHYLRETADNFHRYYNAFQFLVTDDTLRYARLCLIAATQQILANGLQLLGVSAPMSM